MDADVAMHGDARGLTMAGGTPPIDPAAMRARNVRTALVLAGVALTFFFGIIAAEYLGGARAAMGVAGITALLALVPVIGRHRRKGGRS